METIKSACLLPALFFCLACTGGKRPEPAPAQPLKIDVIVDTDLGGDPDDIQSLYRLLHYSDLLDIRGIVSTPCTQLENHPWDTLPQDGVIKNWIMRIDLDHLRANGYRELMPEQEALDRVYRGSPAPGLPAPGRSSAGSGHIVRTAAAHSPGNPLWILVWGSLTTVAQALHDDPAIAPNIRLYYIGSSNTLHDSLSRNYVYEFMEERFSALWWIENGVLPRGRHETFRGVYQGGEQGGEWGNRTFVEMNIRGKGSTRGGYFAEKCGDAFPLANWPAGILKEGDSPSILYLLSPRLAGVGDVDDPTAESWGGRFRPADPARFPNYYIDLDASPDECQATISRWRVDFLAHWKERWKRYDVPQAQEGR
jgi:hypothetical protein